MLDGTYNFTFTDTFAGSTSPASTPLVFTVDTLAPITPAISNYTFGSGGTTVNLSGTAESGDLVAIYDGTLLGYTSADSSGHWSYTTGQLSPGTQSFVAISTDAANNNSSPSAALNVTVAGTPSNAPVQLTGSFEEYFSSGLYWADNSTWGAYGLVNGVDYTQSITFNPATFPNGTTLSWSYPLSPAPNFVYGYPDIIYGSNPYQPHDGVTPTQLGSFANLSATYSITLSGNTALYDTIFDIWFTSQPNGGPSTIDDEIIIYAHRPAGYSPGNYRYTLNDGSALQGATIHDTVQTGAAGKTWHMIEVVPQADILSGTLNLSDLFKSFIWNGLVNPQDWVSGSGFGDEQLQGSGSVFVSNLSYQWNGNPTITLSAGNDTYSVTTPGGNDIVGNGGTDTVIYQGTHSQYQLKQSGTATLIQQGGNISTLDVLNGIAFVKFSDGTYNTATSTFTAQATGPTVSSVVESPASGHLNAGQTVTLTLNLSAAVMVAGGTPTLTLNDGGTATYTSGSGTSALTFSYTVLAGQNTPDLMATAVNLNGATVKDGAGNAASLSLSGLTQTGPYIGTVTPVITSLAESPSNGALNAGKTVMLTVNFNEAVTVAGGTPTLTLNDGGTATYTGGSGSSALTFSYTVLAGQNTPDLMVTAVNLNAASITDIAGNAANLSLSGVTQGSPSIDTVAPTAPVISSNSVSSTNVVTLNGTAEANSTVTVFDGTTQLGTATANASGAWSYATAALSAGSHSFTATDTDAAGNTSAASSALNLTLTAPPVNLVANGSFETGDFTGWTLGGNYTSAQGQNLY